MELILQDLLMAEQNYLFAHFIFESPRPSKQLPVQIHP